MVVVMVCSVCFVQCVLFGLFCAVCFVCCVVFVVLCVGCVVLAVLRLLCFVSSCYVLFVAF